MDLELLEKGLEHAKKKKWGLVLGGLGFTGYGLYTIYNLPFVVKKRQRLSKFLGALVSVAEMMSDSADAIGIVSKDLKEFLGSDSDQIPQSFKQMSKIAKSNEFSESLSLITRALTVGVLQGYENRVRKSGNDPGFPDRVIDKSFSDAGSGFASVVVGSFARNLVMGLYSEWQQDRNADDVNLKSSENVPRWVEVVCEDKCRELIGDCIRLFASTAVAVYLDRTMDVNPYDEIFSGLTNPKHEARVKDMLVTICNGVVESLIRTSHNVWTTNSVPVSKLKSNYSKIDFEDSFTPTKKLKDKNQENGWVRKMSSTLAVPINRKFVLDMTGIVIFETVQSFLEFLLQRMSECMKRSADIVHQEVVDKGVEAIRFASVKSSTVTTLCLTLCLNILNSPWILAPH